ncbi:MAG: hypothetical protein NVS2B16_30400 [Chloroflexota bacterium]
MEGPVSAPWGLPLEQAPSAASTMTPRPRVDNFIALKCIVNGRDHILHSPSRLCGRIEAPRLSPRLICGSSDKVANASVLIERAWVQAIS